MSTRKPQPLNPCKTHDRCPVCGEISYSIGGIHPQCSVRQADEKRLSRIKRKKKPKPVTKVPDTLSRWKRICPKCKAVQHVRKKTCDCGQELAVAIRSSTAADE